MDQHEPTGKTNSNNIDSEVSAAYRLLNGAGNFLKNNKNKAMAVLAAGALTITLAGCGANANAEGPEPTTTTSAEPTPEATQTPDMNEPHDYTDQEIMDMMNEPLPENLVQYEQMSVQEFEALPIEERLSYCSYLNRDQDYLEGNWYDAYDQDAAYLLPDTYDESTSAQDIITAGGYFMSNAFVTHFGGKIYDRDTAQKQIACGFYSPTDTNTQYTYWTNARNQVDRIQPPGATAEGGYLQRGIATGEQPSQTITTPDGHEYFARTITSKDTDGNSFEGTYVLVSYTDYTGEAKQVYVSY